MLSIFLKRLPKRLRLFPTLLLAFLGLALPVHGQLGGGIEGEDLDESESLAVEVQAPTVERSELQRLFDEALLTFHGSDRPASLTLFGHVVDILSAGRETTGLSDGDETLLARALAYRAWVHHDLGLEDRRDEELTAVLRLAPGFDLATLGQEPSPSSVLPGPGTPPSGLDLPASRDGLGPELGPPPPEDLLKAFGNLRKKTIGEIALVLDPYDATVLIDGEALKSLDQPAAVLAGTHDIRIERPGYAPVERRLQVDAGRSITIEETLDRTSAVLRLNTRPREAQIFIDGRPMGYTQGTAEEGFLPQGAAALYRREEFSKETVIENLEQGLRILEVRKAGYRPYRMELVIQDVIDYQMPPIVLEEEGGQLVFVDFPRGGEIRVDGELTAPDIPDVSRPRVSLPPGEYHITVTSGSSKMFSTRLALADRQNVEVRVELKPGLSFLGVLGGDRTAAANLLQSFSIAMRASEKWTLVDRSPDGPAVLAEAGVTAERLRRGERPDWGTVQGAVDRRAPGLLYLLAVLDNDLVATEAEFFLFTAAPGPATPDRVTVPLGSDSALAELRKRLDVGLVLRRPYVGMVTLDSNAGPHPVVAHVVPASPAEAANLQPGDEIVGVAGVPVQSRKELEARFQAAESGETLELVVRGEDAGRNERIVLGSSPRILETSEEVLTAPAYTDLVLLEERARPEDLWVLQLNRAVLLLEAGEHAKAAKLLRSIRGPQTSHGINQGTIDYYLGLALLRTGGAELTNAARQALERAVNLPGARLQHSDGAFLQPRARARLQELKAGGI